MFEVNQIQIMAVGVQQTTKLTLVGRTSFFNTIEKNLQILNGASSKFLKVAF